MRNSTTQHRYSRIPEEPANDEECKAPDDHVQLHLTCTFGWVTGRLGTNQKSRDGLVPGQHSTWGNSRNLRQAWIKHARNAETRETDPQLWRAILAFVPAEEYIRLVLLLVVIVSTRVLQPTMFAAVLSSEPVLLYGSPVPWICFVTAGYWLAVSCEGLARSHYSFFAQLTSASVKSGLTGLVYDKVLLNVKLRTCNTEKGLRGTHVILQSRNSSGRLSTKIICFIGFNSLIMTLELSEYKASCFRALRHLVISGLPGQSLSVANEMHLFRKGKLYAIILNSFQMPYTKFESVVF